MRIAVFAVVAIAIAGAAIAQETQTPATPPLRITWDARPDAQDFARNYPQDALNQQMSGAALLCCTVNEARGLDCTVPVEYPEGQGFGAATLVLASKFTMSADSYAVVRDTQEGRFRTTIRWMMPDETPEAVAVGFEAFRERARNVCPVPPAAPAPATN
ncbi:MAG: hypothetical protein NT015_14370 [Alphaproteobacteria bacterium]|nr:hypothetical protein [Alphaproteobacteria bacterium]